MGAVRRALRVTAPWCTLGGFFHRLWDVVGDRSEDALVSALEQVSEASDGQEGAGNGGASEANASPQPSAITRKGFDNVCLMLDVSAENGVQIWDVVFGFRCTN